MAGYAIKTSLAASTMTLASPGLATVSPTAPVSICIFAKKIDLCVLVWGRNWRPFAAV